MQLFLGKAVVHLYAKRIIRGDFRRNGAQHNYNDIGLNKDYTSCPEYSNASPKH